MSFLRLALCFLLAACFLPSGAQQAQSAVPPAVLQIYRDSVKPSKMAEYSRIEGEAAQACARASTWPYLTIQSITGTQEVWFLSGFDSYAALERSAESFVRNAALNAELQRLLEAKANLVTDPRVVYASYRDDLSGTSGFILPGARFFTVTTVDCPSRLTNGSLKRFIAHLNRPGKEPAVKIIACFTRSSPECRETSI